MKTIMQSVEENQTKYEELVQYMYDNPELGLEEFKASDAICKVLEEEGFQVKRNNTLETDFIATYDSKKAGPTIAFLCEYDALPNVGHGCGHNLIAGIGVAAGTALKDVLDEVGGRVQVIGTPAEETFGGKINLVEAGYFKDVDVALMIHPSTDNRLGGRTLALNPIRFEFFGKSAHGCNPSVGASALDAAVATYTNISMFRQFVKPDTFIHGIIRNGGGAANVVPDYASMEYYFRGKTTAYVKELSERGIECAKAGALASGCTMKWDIYETPYEDNKINYTLAEMLREEYADLGLSDIKDVEETPRGSSDIGSVAYVCPALHGYIKIAEDGVNGHSCEMADATISPTGKKALHDGAIALANIGYRLIKFPEDLKRVKEEFLKD